MITSCIGKNIFKRCVLEKTFISNFFLNVSMFHVELINKIIIVLYIYYLWESLTVDWAEI
jgi:hypothetical protein